jgi:hypothetical protein
MKLQSPAARVILVLAITLVTTLTVTAATYTFDNLNTGALAGQDNWVLRSGQTSFQIVNGNGGNIATRADTNADVHDIDRANSGSFSFDLTNAATFTMSLDAQVHNSATQHEIIIFGIGDPFAVNGNYNGTAIRYEQSPGSAPNFAWGGASYPGHPATGALGSLPAFPTNDWIRLSLVVDTAANGGQGFGTVYVQDLTTNGPMQMVASNLNMNLDPAGNLGQWQTMSLRSDALTPIGPVDFDNLTVSATFAAVPEMNGAWIAGACAMMLAGHFVRRRSRRVTA